MICKLNNFKICYENIAVASEQTLWACVICFMHKINTQGHNPIATAAYRQSGGRRTITNKLVQEFFEQDLIQESCSPWASPVVLVTTKNGETRFCVGY